MTLTQLKCTVLGGRNEGKVLPTYTEGFVINRHFFLSSRTYLEDVKRRLFMWDVLRQFHFFPDEHVLTALLLTNNQDKSTKCKPTSVILFQTTQNHKVVQSGFAPYHYQHKWRIFITKSNLLRWCTTFTCKTERPLLLACIKPSQKNGHSNLTLEKRNLNVPHTSTIHSGHTIMYWYQIYTNFRTKIICFSILSRSLFYSSDAPGRNFMRDEPVLTSMTSFEELEKNLLVPAVHK